MRLLPSLLRGLGRLLGRLHLLLVSCLGLLSAPLLGLGDRAADRGHDVVLGEVGVPDVHRSHLRELRHRLPVGRHGRQRRCAGVSLRESVVARRDREAGRHPFHVVLEWPRKGLVEIVQIEQQLPLRRSEHAEIRQVGIAAQLDDQPRRRCALEVRGHDLRRTPVEGERRNHHPAMPDRHEVGLAGGVLLFEQRNRVGPVRGRTPAPVTRRRRSTPGVLTLGLPLVGTQMCDPFRRHRPTSSSGCPP